MFRCISNPGDLKSWLWDYVNSHLIKFGHQRPRVSSHSIGLEFDPSLVPQLVTSAIVSLRWLLDDYLYVGIFTIYSLVVITWQQFTEHEVHFPYSNLLIERTQPSIAVRKLKTTWEDCHEAYSSLLCSQCSVCSGSWCAVTAQTRGSRWDDKVNYLVTWSLLTSSKSQLGVKRQTYQTFLLFFENFYLDGILIKLEMFQFSV